VTAPKIGDVVAWALCGTIPWGALLAYREGWTAVRVGNGGFRWAQMDGIWCHNPVFWKDGGIMEDGARWDLLEGSVTIIALHLTGQETAADLRRRAEVFEVREALRSVPSIPVMGRNVFLVLDGHVWAWGFGGGDDGEIRMRFAERLHAAGWRPGMTAEDAARLLSETGDKT
jgi:hypothetical protein